MPAEMCIRDSYNLLESVLKTRRFWLEEENADSRALELLAVFDLDKKADMRAGNLPYGQQRKLEIARALATNPKLLCLDEPAAGMNNTCLLYTSARCWA